MNVRSLSPRTLALALLVTAGALAIAASSVSAHGHQSVGPYDFTIGWQTEPAIVGVANAVTIEIVENDTVPVVGADAGLTATLMAGGQSSVRPMEPAFGEPGLYTVGLIPTREGAYSVRIAGMLNGTAVNLTAEIERPEAADEYQFPAVDPSAHDLEEALADERANNTALAARVTALEGASTSCGAGAKCAESSGTLIAYAGLAAGAAGIVVGLIALRKGRAPK